MKWKMLQAEKANVCVSQNLEFESFTFAIVLSVYVCEAFPINYAM